MPSFARLKIRLESARNRAVCNISIRLVKKWTILTHFFGISFDFRFYKGRQAVEGPLYKGHILSLSI